MSTADLCDLLTDVRDTREEHPAALLDYERAVIFSVKASAEGMKVAPATTPAQLWTVCADLGYRPSDLLQANAIIWVEGPSDRIYINHWLDQQAPDLVEGIDYSIMSTAAGCCHT